MWWWSKQRTRPALLRGRERSQTGRRLVVLWSSTSGAVLTDLKSAQLSNRKRDISGDDLRREFWVHEEASSPKKKKKAGKMSFFRYSTFLIIFQSKLLKTKPPGRGYDVKLNQPKVPPVTTGAAKPAKDPAKAPGWMSKLCFDENLELHILQSYGFILSWTDEMCFFKVH